MLWFGLLIGGILVIAGIATHYVAPRVGPNPIFGVRIGYAYASRQVWDKTNRFGGTLLALVGVGAMILGIGLHWLNVGVRDGINILTIVTMATLIGATAWMFVYARTLSQGTPLAHELAPVRFRWRYLAPVLVTFALLVVLAVAWYPALPAQMAVHFNMAEKPDGWQARDEFLVMYLGLGTFLVVLNALVVLIATREPLIAFGRGMGWRLDPERGLLFLGLGSALAHGIMIAVFWNVAWFNTQGVHAFSYWWILGMIVPLLGLIVGLFFVLARRDS